MVTTWEMATESEAMEMELPEQHETTAELAEPKSMVAQLTTT
jgi:hypothetical protein